MRVKYLIPDTVRLDDSVSGSHPCERFQINMIPIKRSELCVPDGKVYRFVNDRIVFEEVSLPMKCSVWKENIQRSI